VVNPKLTTFVVDPTRKKVPRVVSQVSPEGRLLLIPANVEMSLKVLEGDEKGTVYPVSKPRFLIGRTNGDINLNDDRISRVHCAIESTAEGVMLRDLESTNGTFIEDKRIDSASLADGSKFRVGNHGLQLIIVKREVE
jgi:predicted component of type VI protein secretion system